MDNILDSGDSMGELAFKERDPLGGKYQGMAFPSLVTRIKALFMDLLIMLVIFTGTTLFIDAFGDIPNFVRGFILIFMVYLYDPVFTSFTDSTPGHKMMGLKVRKHADPEKKISLGQAFLRFFIKAILGWISFLTVTSNKRKRAHSRSGQRIHHPGSEITWRPPCLRVIKLPS